jgi:hypothetical protein
MSAALDTYDRCEGCSRASKWVAYSYRLGKGACWNCYHGSFTGAEIAELDRCDRRSGLLLAAHTAALVLPPEHPNRQPLLDRALLLEIPGPAAPVHEIAREIEGLLR